MGWGGFGGGGRVVVHAGFFFSFLGGIYFHNPPNSNMDYMGVCNSILQLLSERKKNWSCLSLHLGAFGE